MGSVTKEFLKKMQFKNIWGVIHLSVRELSNKYKQKVINLRREFHKYPEASLHEYKTIERIGRELDKMGVSYKNVADTGIIAEIKGTNPGKTIALRADIDALSVKELNECDSLL
ncbi:MAG: metal-dependent amidase/aminoacylase/carboxypeptidase family protein [Clostridium sp.]|jgi:metal-dependent amidase/aminoacylase/carboxypeptidase family protein